MHTSSAAHAQVVKKEGGKKGAEVAGAADMGGMTHMNVSLDLPEGRTDMMLKALEAMNVGRFRIRLCPAIDKRGIAVRVAAYEERK